MFDTKVASVGLPAGEADTASGWRDDDIDDFVHSLIIDELNTGWPQPDRHVLPDDLEEITGPFLAAVVSSVDPARLNGHDVVRLMQARARLSSHHEAHKYEAITEIAFSSPSDAGSGVLRSSEQVDYAAVEVGAALSLTRRSSERQVDFAVALTGTLSRVWELFSRGELDLARVRVFDDHLSHLPEETIETVLDQILDDARWLTTGQLGSRLGKLVKTADPDGSKASFEQGLGERRVVATANPEGLSDPLCKGCGLT